MYSHEEPVRQKLANVPKIFIGRDSTEQSPPSWLSSRAFGGRCLLFRAWRRPWLGGWRAPISIRVVSSMPLLWWRAFSLDENVTKEPAPAYLMMGQLFADFEKEYGTLCCHELVGVSPDLSLDDFLAQLKAKETRTRVCDGLKVFTIRRFFELLPEWEKVANA